MGRHYLRGENIYSNTGTVNLPITWKDEGGMAGPKSIYKQDL